MDTNESKYLNIKPPKEIVWAVVVFLAVLIVFFGVKISNELSGYNRILQPATITASGEGKILAKPDIAMVNIGVLKENYDFLQAQRAAADVMDRVMSDLKKNNIAEKDIKTTSYNISPMYDYNYKDGGRRFRGYQVSQNLEVKIRDLNKVGDILAGAAGSGANQIGSLSFSIDDPKKAKEEARTLAIAEAKTRAAKLADDLGVKLIKITSYGESGNGGPFPMYAKTDAMGMGGEGMPPPIPAGENEISVTVNLTYEIK